MNLVLAVLNLGHLSTYGKMRSHFTEERGLSVRVVDSRSRGCWFEPHRRHCIVSLSKTLYLLLSTGATQEGLSRHD